MTQPLDRWPDIPSVIPLDTRIMTPNWRPGDRVFLRVESCVEPADVEARGRIRAVEYYTVGAENRLIRITGSEFDRGIFVTDE